MSNRTTVLVCRGCCCGTERKHPDIDHAAHLDTLRSALPAGRSTKLWTVDCLGPCDHSNVIVVRTGATRRWFGDILADDDIQTLANWIRTGTASPPPAVLQSHEFTVPHEPAVIPTRLLQLRTGQLRDLAHHALRAAGSWSMGVHGATAEFHADGATLATGEGHAIEATTPTGAIRLHIDDDTHVLRIGSDEPDAPAGPLIFATVSRRAAPRHVITELGLDADPIHPDDRRGVVFDLGLGRGAAAFCVRAVGDTVDILRTECGKNWRDVYDRLTPTLIERSPHRIVLAGRGRTEVTSVIPAPGAASPAGSRTHLLPGELEFGRELPPGLTLPTGLRATAIFFPPTGWIAEFQGFDT